MSVTWLVDDLIAALRGLGPLTVGEPEAARGTVRSTPPAAVRA
jgi:hypothetical protein